MARYTIALLILALGGAGVSAQIILENTSPAGGGPGAAQGGSAGAQNGRGGRLVCVCVCEAR